MSGDDDQNDQVTSRVGVLRRRARRQVATGLASAIVVVAVAGGVAAGRSGDGAVEVNVASVVPAESTGAPVSTTATQIVNVRPVDATGHLKTGYQVTRTGIVDTSNPVRCVASELVGGAFRCDGYDPCWTDSEQAAAPSVVCLAGPTGHDLTREILDSSPGSARWPANNPDADDPWAVALTSGQECSKMGGAGDAVAGSIVDYACTSGAEDDYVVLLEGIDRNSRQWVMQSAMHHADGTYTLGEVVPLATVWYGQPSDG